MPEQKSIARKAIYLAAKSHETRPSPGVSNDSFFKSGIPKTLSKIVLYSMATKKSLPTSAIEITSEIFRENYKHLGPRALVKDIGAAIFPGFSAFIEKWWFTESEGPAEYSPDAFCTLNSELDEALFELSESDQDVREWLNSEIPGQFNFGLNSSLEELLQTLPESARDQAATLLKSEGEGPKLVAAKILPQVKKNLAAVTEAAKNEIEANGSERTAKRLTREEKQKELESGVYLAQTFLRLTGNPEAARYIGGSFEIYKRVSKLLSVKDSMPLTMMSGYVGVAMMALDLFGGAKKNGFEVYIQEALGQVMESLSVLHEKLDAVLENQRLILDELMEIKADISELNTKLDSVRARLESISRKESIHFEIGKLMARSEREGDFHAARTSLDSERNTMRTRGKYESEPVREALSMITRYAEAADEPAFTGYLGGKWNGDAVRDAIRLSPVELGIDSQAGLVPSIAAHVGDSRAIRSGALLNAGVLVQSGEAILRAVREFPDFFEHRPGYLMDGGQAHVIAQQGTRLLGGIADLFDRDMLSALAERYLSLARDLVLGSPKESTEGLVTRLYREHKEENNGLDLYAHRPYWQGRVFAVKPGSNPQQCVSWEQLLETIGETQQGFALDITSLEKGNRPQHGQFVSVDPARSLDVQDLGRIGALSLSKVGKREWKDRSTSEELPIPNGHHRRVSWKRDLFRVQFYSGKYEGEAFSWYSYVVNRTQAGLTHGPDPSVWVSGVVPSSHKLAGKGGTEYELPDTPALLPFIEEQAEAHYRLVKHEFMSKLVNALESEADPRFSEFIDTAVALGFMGALAVWCRGEANLQVATSIARSPNTLFGSGESLARLLGDLVSRADDQADGEDAKVHTLEVHLAEGILERITENLQTFMTTAFAESAEEYVGPEDLRMTTLGLDGAMGLAQSARG